MKMNDDPEALSPEAMKYYEGFVTAASKIFPDGIPASVNADSVELAQQAAYADTLLKTPVVFSELSPEHRRNFVMSAMQILREDAAATVQGLAPDTMTEETIENMAETISYFLALKMGADKAVNLLKIPLDLARAMLSLKTLFNEEEER